jgi:prophage regulatory protein
MLLGRQIQLRLPMGSHKPKSQAALPGANGEPEADRQQIDQLLSTRDVVRITGKHRCTIYRWIRAGTFPAKRAGGGRGWLRSDVERWLGSGNSSRD